MLFLNIPEYFLSFTYVDLSSRSYDQLFNIYFADLIKRL